MIQTDADEAIMHLPELIEAAARGEEVRIAASRLQGQPMVRLVAVTPQQHDPQFGSARGLVTLTEDFDAPLPDFASYQ